MTDTNPITVACPWCNAAPGERCTRPASFRSMPPHDARIRAAADVTPTENRPTIIPKPNRPDRTLGHD